MDFGDQPQKVGFDVNFELSWFLDQVWNSPVLMITVLLTLGVILVNGWTDAPNAMFAP